MHKSNPQRRTRSSFGIKSRKTPTRETKSLVVAPTRLVSDDRVLMAISALNNNSTVLVSECKNGSTKTISYNADVLATLRGMFPSDKTYLFQIHTTGTLISSGAGVVATAYSASPSVATYSEWAALAALFDECKLVKSKLGVTSSALLTKAIPLWIAFDRVNSSSAAPGFGNVQRLAQSKCIQSNAMNGGSARHMQSISISPLRVYAPTSAPSSSVVDLGCNGQWDIVGQDSTAISTIAAYIDIENVVRFRNRA
jgi:hypothetical protein